MSTKKEYFLAILPIFLIILFPVLNLRYTNIISIGTIEMMFLLVPSSLLATVLISFFSLVYKNFSKSALFTIYLLLFFFYFHYGLEAFNFFTQEKFGIIFFRMRYILLAFSVLSAFIFYKIYKAKKTPSVFFMLLTIFFGTINLFYIKDIFVLTQSFKQKIKKITNENDLFYKETFKEYFDNKNNVSTQKKLPDIYLIVLDMYLAPKNLKKYWNCNVDDFLQKLEKNGFYIAHDSKSNYPCTSSSFASSMNMRYLEQSCPIHTNIKKATDNNVVKFLKDNGYTIKNILSDTPVTQCISYPKSKNFWQHIKKSWYFFSQTFGLFRLFLTTRTFLFYQSPITRWLQSYIENKHKDIVLDQIEHLKKSIKTPGPKFVFCHILCPHPPYVFAKKSHNKLQHVSDVLTLPTSNDEEKIDYPQQVKAINKHIFETIETILDKTSTEKPIIILQSDHGHPHYGTLQGGDPNGERFPSYFAEEAFGILNAWYLPDKNYKILNQDMTLVNNFRIIFDTYFGTNLGNLENKCFLQKTKICPKTGKTIALYATSDTLFELAKEKELINPKEIEKLFADR